MYVGRYAFNISRVSSLSYIVCGMKNKKNINVTKLYIRVYTHILCFNLFLYNTLHL